MTKPTKSEQIEREFNRLYNAHTCMKKALSHLPKSPKGKYLYAKLNGLVLDMEGYMNHLSKDYSTIQEKERELARKEREVYNNSVMFNGAFKEVMEEWVEIAQTAGTHPKFISYIVEE